MGQEQAGGEAWQHRPGGGEWGMAALAVGGGLRCIVVYMHVHTTTRNVARMPPPPPPYTHTHTHLSPFCSIVYP